MSSGKANQSENQNREIVRILFEEVWNQKDFNNFYGKVANDVVMHFRGLSFSTNIEELQQIVEYWHDAFSNLYYKIGHLIAEDDIVAVRLEVSGIHSGTWEGISASGNKIEFSEMMFFRFHEGIIVEMWEDYDEITLRKQVETNNSDQLTFS